MEVKLQYIQVSVRKGPKVPPASVSMSFVLFGWHLASRTHIRKFRGLCMAQMNVALYFPCPPNNRASNLSTLHIREQLLMLPASRLKMHRRDRARNKRKESCRHNIEEGKLGSGGIDPKFSTSTLDGREWSGYSLWTKTVVLNGQVAGWTPESVWTRSRWEQRVTGGGYSFGC
jgi:hypothetical protein